MGTLDTYEGINGPGTLPGGGTWPDPHNWREAGFSSYHPGGCHFLLVDGSVHFLGENIAADVLTALTTRAQGEPVPAEAF